MDRQRLTPVKLALIAVLSFTGCQPTQPFFANEDGDLSHYLDKSTTIDFPDLQSEPLPDAAQAQEPYTLIHPEKNDFWDLSLEEAVAVALQNSKVLRSIAQVRQTRQVGQGVAGPPESLSINGDFTSTVYDPAIEQSGQNGVEAALSAFDAQWNTNIFWDNTDRPQNVNDATGGTTIFARLLQRDNVNFQSELTKRSVTGTQWSFRNVSTYDASNRPLRVQASEWFTSFEAEARHPLMRGSGTQVNRLPIMLARIRTDVSLVRFETSVRDLLLEIERAYWDLYFYYRNLQTAKVGRDSAQGTWKRINAIYEQGGPSVSGEQEAQAREQYFFFRGRLEEAKRDLLKAERQLRFLMGISPTDGRILRPIDEPTLARVKFEWSDILAESLTRTGEIRARKWIVKQRELELIAARNNLLPQFDLVALYRWLGLGDELLSHGRDGANFPDFGSTAFDELVEGRFQEWRLGLDVQVPIGARAAHSAVRNQELLLARSKARLEDLELEMTHRLTDAIQNLDSNYVLTQVAFLQRAAAQRQVDVLENKVEMGSVTLDLLLDAQRRSAEAERAFYQSLLQYNLAVLEVHYAKGSLLDYCGVALQEGPWPAKAYFDALVRARQRDASYYFDYGYTRPGVVSRGPVPPLNDGTVEAPDTGQPTPAETNSPELQNPDYETIPPQETDGDGGPLPQANSHRFHHELRDVLGVAAPANQRADVARKTNSSPPTSKFSWDGVIE